MLGAASGILFGVSDVAIKAITGLGGSRGSWPSRRPGWRSRSSASVAAFYASARGLQVRRGRPGHRHHRHGRQRLVHRRRHHRLRRPDARRRRSGSSSNASRSPWSSSPPRSCPPRCGSRARRDRLSPGAVEQQPGHRVRLVQHRQVPAPFQRDQSRPRQRCERAARLAEWQHAVRGPRRWSPGTSPARRPRRGRRRRRHEPVEVGAARQSWVASTSDIARNAGAVDEHRIAQRRPQRRRSEKRRGRGVDQRSRRGRSAGPTAGSVAHRGVQKPDGDISVSVRARRRAASSSATNAAQRVAGDVGIVDRLVVEELRDRRRERRGRRAYARRATAVTRRSPARSTAHHVALGAEQRP